MYFVLLVLLFLGLHQQNWARKYNYEYILIFTHMSAYKYIFKYILKSWVHADYSNPISECILASALSPEDLGEN